MSNNSLLRLSALISRPPFTGYYYLTGLLHVDTGRVISYHHHSQITCTRYRHFSATATQELIIPTTSTQDAGGPLAAYRALVQSGKIVLDAHQVSVVRQLQVLFDQLVVQSKKHSSDNTNVMHFTSRFISKSFQKILGGTVDTTMPTVGTPGGGKTFIMDLFANSIPEGTIPRSRFHFNQLMLYVHTRLHQLKKTSNSSSNTLRVVAKELATNARIICLDEFQVTNISDAMILFSLLDMLWEFNAVLVFTSNRHPSDLYLNGIQRDSFVPCIDLIHQKCLVVQLNPQTDYRQREQGLNRVYFRSKELAQAVWTNLTLGYPTPTQRDLSHSGRYVRIPTQIPGRIAKFTFASLCNEPLGAADYLALVTNYPIIMVTEIPTLSVIENRNEIRRFIVFVDTVYDAKICLLLQSLNPVHDLVSVSDASLVDEERFAMDRTVSRLIEMQGEEWPVVVANEVRLAVAKAQADVNVKRIVNEAGIVPGRVAYGELNSENPDM